AGWTDRPGRPLRDRETPRRDRGRVLVVAVPGSVGTSTSTRSPHEPPRPRSSRPRSSPASEDPHGAQAGRPDQHEQRNGAPPASDRPDSRSRAPGRVTADVVPTRRRADPADAVGRRSPLAGVPGAARAPGAPGRPDLAARRLELSAWSGGTWPDHGSRRPSSTPGATSP